MNENRNIYLTIDMDLDSSMKEIKKRNDIFLLKLADGVLKVFPPLRTKMVLTFLKSKKTNILTGINHYLQQYHLGQVGDISMEEIADQRIKFILEDTQINYQELSEFDLIPTELLKKGIGTMKHTWIEKNVISILNTNIVKNKVLNKVSPAVRKLLFEKWGVYAKISDYTIV